MDETLQTLIAYYEEEKKWLLQQISDYTKEWEYQFAEYHAQALFRVNGRLQTLYSLRDRRHDEKVWKQNSIRHLENELQSEMPAHMRDYFSERLQREKDVLEKLNQLDEPVNEAPNGGAFNETLDNLFEKRIKSFTLVVSREDNFLFEFSYKAKTLKVVIPHIRLLIDELFSGQHISVLLEMGFTLTKNKSKLILHLIGNRETLVYELKWRLAKIIFELFYFPSFSGKSYIEIKDKPSQ